MNSIAEYEAIFEELFNEFLRVNGEITSLQEKLSLASGKRDLAELFGLQLEMATINVQNICVAFEILLDEVSGADFSLTPARTMIIPGVPRDCEIVRMRATEGGLLKSFQRGVVDLNLCKISLITKVLDKLFMKLEILESMRSTKEGECLHSLLRTEIKAGLEKEMRIVKCTILFEFATKFGIDLQPDEFEYFKRAPTRVRIVLLDCLSAIKEATCEGMFKKIVTFPERCRGIIPERILKELNVCELM